METQTQEPMRAGHWWKEPDRVAEYINRWDKESDEISKIFALLTSLLPFEKDAPIRILDVGSGHGVLAAAVLDAFPNATAVGLDISEAMMEEGSARMKRFGGRFRYFEGDFADGTLPSNLPGTFDLVVSSRAIHHLPPEGKQKLFADIRAHLNDGGCFFNVDNTRPSDEFFRPRYSQAADPSQPPRPPRPANAPPRQAGGNREFPDPADNQVTWLREAGFAHVDVPWKHLGRSMLAAFK